MTKHIFFLQVPQLVLGVLVLERIVFHLLLQHLQVVRVAQVFLEDQIRQVGLVVPEVQINCFEKMQCRNYLYPAKMNQGVTFHSFKLQKLSIEHA